MPDLFRTLVDGIAERDDLVAAAGARAEAMPSVPLRDSVEDLVAEVVRRALIASAAGLKAQIKAAVANVRAEAKAVIGTDPRKIRAITDIDVAERKAELIAAQDNNGAAR